MLNKILNIRSQLKRLKQQDQRERYFSALLEHNLGDTLKFSDSVLQKVRLMIKEQYGMESFSETIHRNDIMFHYHLLQVEGDMLAALFSHYAVGARFLVELNQLLSDIGHVPKKLLDFGSGYGRVSRFMPQMWPEAEIVVSEVKADAMTFQSEYFGFKTIEHSQAASSLRGETYDLILALSVFSHLPETSFRDWVKVLVSKLNRGGRFIFSFNVLQKARDNEDFRYVQNSEDLHFPFISSANLDPEEYGHAYISRELITQLTDSTNVEIEFLGNRLSPQQETVMISRKA